MSQAVSSAVIADAAADAPAAGGVRCRWAFALLLAMAATDFVWNGWAGLHFYGWAHPIAAVVAMWLLAAFYLVARPRTQIAEMALYASFWIAFTLLGAIQTYLGASLARPLIDAALASVDERAGFNAMAWSVFVHSHPVAHMLFRVAYYSLMAQTVATIIVLAIRNVQGRNQELLLNTGVALVFTTAISTLWPAMGTFFHYGIVAFNPVDSEFVAHMIALRQPQLPPFALDQMQGIITFPSFHAVLACLFVYAHRGLGWSFHAALAVNAAMLLGIPTEGGHYLADIVAGFVVAGAAIAIVAAASRSSLVAQPWIGGCRSA